MKEKRQGWWLALGVLTVAVLAGGVMPAPVQAEPEEHAVVFAGPGRLGVGISDVTAARLAELKLASETGAVIDEVEADSPAAKAGLQKNDVILAFAGERVRSAAQLRRLVQETPAGRKVSMEISRGGQTRTMEVTLEERAWSRRLPRIEMPDFQVRLPRIEIPEIHVFRRGPRLGISADELTPQLAEYFGVKQGKGILVREVMEGSAAAKAGLKAGDVIVRVDEDAIADVGDLRQALAKRESQEVTLGIVRDRREQTLKVRLEAPQSVTPRRSAELNWVDDEGELHRLAAEAQAEAAEIQKEMHHLQRELQRQLRDEQRLWQENYRREREQEQQKLRQELEKKIRRELRRVDLI
jgi:membrane-associated protease RseP (regulator of RpoE activity)